MRLYDGFLSRCMRPPIGSPRRYSMAWKYRGRCKLDFGGTALVEYVQHRRSPRWPSQLCRSSLPIKSRSSELMRSGCASSNCSSSVVPDRGKPVNKATRRLADVRFRPASGEIFAREAVEHLANLCMQLFRCCQDTSLRAFAAHVCNSRSPQLRHPNHLRDLSSGRFRSRPGKHSRCRPERARSIGGRLLRPVRVASAAVEFVPARAIPGESRIRSAPFAR